MKGPYECTNTSLLYTGTHSQNIQIYDRSTLNHHCTLNGHIGIVTVVKVTESTYGVYMFSASSDTTVQVCVCMCVCVCVCVCVCECECLSVCEGTVKTGKLDREGSHFPHPGVEPGEHAAHTGSSET